MKESDKRVEKRNIKGIGMRYVHTPSPHKEQKYLLKASPKGNKSKGSQGMSGGRRSKRKKG